jgi:hypothetical protein
VSGIGASRTQEDFSRPPGVEVIVSRDDSALLVAFSGLRPPQGSHYDFRRASAGLAASRVLVRDHHRSWYQEGVLGVDGGLDGVRNLLSDIRATLGPSRVVSAGASAGGYAALLFAELLGFDESHAFAPQTFIGEGAMRRFREPRWREESRRIASEGVLDPQLADLRQLVDNGSPEACTVHHIYFDPAASADAVHVARLAGHDRVRLHAFGEGDHDVAEMLARRGDLRRILANALSGDPTPQLQDELAIYDLPVRVPLAYRARRQFRIVRNQVEVRLGRQPVQYY